MTKLKQQDYGLMDIPLSCSIFLERALLDILKSSHYNIHIGADACRTYSYANLRFSSASLHINKNTPNRVFLFLGRMTGFEPATFGTTNQRSNQLSYIRHTETWWS